MALFYIPPADSTLLSDQPSTYPALTSHSPNMLHVPVQRIVDLLSLDESHRRERDCDLYQILLRKALPQDILDTPMNVKDGWMSMIVS